MAKNKSKSIATEVPFEEALEQLKSVVAELENGNLSLTVSLEKYGQGVKSLKDCYQALESAQKKIELLVRLDEHGKLITQPFEAEATHSPTVKTTQKKGYSDSAKTVKPSADQQIESAFNDDEFDDEDEFDPNSLF